MISNSSSSASRHYSHIVIGGGLSGLCVCRGLEQANHNWLLLEARSLWGGRLVNDNQHAQIDMGGAWIWPEHQPCMRQLVRDLNVSTFRQPDDPSSTRIEGGAVQFIHKLVAQLAPERLRLNTPVTSCRLIPNPDKNDSTDTIVQVESSNGESWTCRHVVFAVPPRLLDKHITFDPPLSTVKQAAQRASHTWMAGVTKVALVYPMAFWKQQHKRCITNMGLSGEPAFQVYDGSTKDGSLAALTCFTMATNIDDNAELAKQVATQLSEQWSRMGLPVEHARQAHSYSSAHVQKWPSEVYISEEPHPTRIHSHPMPVAALSTPEWNGALLFAGSESDRASPGVMEGAVSAAQRVLKELQQLL